MGVMQCDRKDCDNIMCDRCIGEYYVCNDCAKEFAQQVGDYKRPKPEMAKLFVEFMQTPKPPYHGHETVTPEEFLGST